MNSSFYNQYPFSPVEVMKKQRSLLMPNTNEQTIENFVTDPNYDSWEDIANSMMVRPPKYVQTPMVQEPMKRMFSNLPSNDFTNIDIWSSKKENLLLILLVLVTVVCVIQVYTSLAIKNQMKDYILLRSRLNAF